MTERGRARVQRDRDSLAIGPSALRWDGTSLTIDIEEVTAPIPSRIRGTVRVHPSALTGRTFDLHDGHRWSPLAPIVRVEVALSSPGLSWSGPGYLDCNEGDVPLESSFAQWAWSRAKLRDATAVLYEGERLDGDPFSLALRFTEGGSVESFTPPEKAMLPLTRWRMQRPTRTDPGQSPSVRQTLEDAPFYARSVIETTLLGERVTAMHESLSLRRFRMPVVQAMLPFRVPRRG